MHVAVGVDVLHVVKCVSVEVRVQHEETCYIELQVTGNNRTFYSTLQTHELKIKTHHVYWTPNSNPT